jgi:hypothetical protein
MEKLSEVTVKNIAININGQLIVDESLFETTNNFDRKQRISGSV